MENELDIPALMYKWAGDLPPKVINMISPSQIGGCMRKHWYSIKHAPITTPTNPGAILNMQTGFMWEELITKSLLHAHIPFISQWKMRSIKYPMEGTLDYGIIKDNTLEIWDSKTESSLAYKYRHGSYLDSHEDYVHQLNCYAIMARENGFTVTRGGFVVIRRDDSYIEKVPFMFDELRIAETEARIKTLQKHLDDNTLPPCDGKFCTANGTIGLCDFGNPETQVANKKGKVVNTSCCPVPKVLKEWADKLEAKK
jgi:hypothetical protein